MRAHDLLRVVPLVLLGACGDLTSTGPVTENHYQWYVIGTDRTCGIRNGSEGWCSEEAGGRPLVRVMESEGVREFVFGWSHTCALASDATAWCWGQTGTTARETLGRFEGAVDLPAPAMTETRFTALAAGAERTCGLAPDGAVWCWGFSNGPLFGAPHPSPPEYCGDESCALPTRMPGDLRFTALGLGDEHACGLTRGGEVWCWGSNLEGELGIGVSADPTSCAEIPCHLPPSRVAATVAFEALAVSSSGGCGLSGAGEAWCWGNGFPTPARVAGSMRFEQLAGGAMVCGIDRGRRAWCWVPAGDGADSDGAVPHSIPDLYFDAVFPSPFGYGCAANSVVGAACWSGIDGRPEPVDGQL